ncbi:hypothetical protein J31TS4_14420 [Paenibacillus sp. J31TS4]|uniref:stalk domain-containing protein n=1 Tax=Paenibacillus sp. J31TS4 TaxID=2807195 RepID=UPI001B21098E|nr:stalk domain-containing protein [Paenibacillus sp. J31TS4]GIP38162.1 hypothetical protein J31TS4_14420 [Paenibacillus sp. J31TS4]
MKKFVLGLACGVGLTAATAAYASGTIQAYLFPAGFVIHGKEAKLEPDYTVLNVDGHAYVPIRFVAEQLGQLVKYENATKTITISETPLSKKLRLDESFFAAMAQGRLPDIPLGIGASREAVHAGYGEPQRTGTRQTEYEEWFDYQYYFGADGTVGSIGVHGETVAYSVTEVKKALGKPASEEESMIDDGWVLFYTSGGYSIYFSADKPDGTVRHVTFKRADPIHGG